MDKHCFAPEIYDAIKHAIEMSVGKDLHLLKYSSVMLALEIDGKKYALKLSLKEVQEWHDPFENL